MKVSKVKDLGPQFVNNKHKMVGQDGAYSIPLGSSKALWFFGDTLIGTRTIGESLWYWFGEPVGPGDMSGKKGIDKMINNTALILKDASGKNGLNNFDYILGADGKLKPLVPLDNDESPDEIRNWCLHGIKLKNKIYLYFIKVKMIEGAVLPVNFEVLGSGLAVGSERDWEFSKIYFNNSQMLWKADEPKFASAVYFDEKDEWIYLYGVVPSSDNIQQCYAARVRPGNIEDASSYEYLSSSKPEWSVDIKQAVPVFTNVPNELSVSYNKYLEKYLAVHSFDLTGKIVARTSEHPWGPWSGPHELFHVKAKREKELPYPVLIYAGKEHPELAGENGKIIFVTYIEFEEYFPHLLEIHIDKV